MPTIVPVTAGDPAAAQSLFREYGQWLRTTKSCGTNYPILDDEIASMPASYTTRNGEVLLALIDGQPAACIAYRALPDTPAECEIKRLFVRPPFEHRGLARALVAEALARARARHFTRAILDTDTGTMPAAHALYLSLGFREYAPRQGSLAYLDLALN
jgi:GNAT superfamily N-acetyltransferase